MEFKCPVCQREYSKTWQSSLKNYKQPNGELVNYVICTKDGAPALEIKKNEDSGVIGEAIIGVAAIQ